MNKFPYVLTAALVSLFVSVSAHALPEPDMFCFKRQVGCKAFLNGKYTKAFKQRARAASQGNRSAQYYLATMYETQLGVKPKRKNLKKAVSWYKTSSGNGFRRAQYRMGQLYYYGLRDGHKSIVKQNTRRAVKQYRQSANNGFAPAQTALGELYLTGDGVKSSKKRAFKLFKKAAKQDYPDAQFQLGMMYLMGNGVGYNLEKAIYWLTRSAQLGNPQAIQSLGQL